MLASQLGEAEQPVELHRSPRLGQEEAFAGSAVDPPLVHQLGERLPDGDPGDAESLDQLPLGWQPVVGPQLVRLDAGDDPLFELTVERHRRLSLQRLNRRFHAFSMTCHNR
nr:hypothetical protein [Fodinicola feengrottensis]